MTYGLYIRHADWSVYTLILVLLYLMSACCDNFRAAATLSENPQRQ